MELLPTNNPSSSAFFGPVKQSESDSCSATRNHDPLELHENDVVWSFSVSSDSSHPHPTATFRSQPYHRNRFNPVNSGLSAALSDDRCHLVFRRSSPRVIALATRQADAPPSNFRRSDPVNIPAWPKNCGGNFSKRIDGGGEKETMVPPHVMVARSHVTFSVFEGAGRTLKGRDMRRLRNTVFQKTGFID